MDPFVDFVKPKSRRKNEQGKLLPQDDKYAEIDACSDLGDASEASYNKFDEAESIVGFYGAETPVKNKVDDIEGSEVTNYDKDIFSDEEEYEDNESEDDVESMSRLKIERLLKDQNDQSKENHVTSKSIELKFVDNEIFMKNNDAYKLYEKVVNAIVERLPKARETFFDAKVHVEWENNKMSQMKKKLNKETKLHEEFLRFGERNLRTHVENGIYKRIPGFAGNLTHLYTKIRPLVPRETQTLEEIIDDAHLFEKDLNLCDENMELTLEDLEADDSNVICSDFDISEMELDNTEDEGETDTNDVQPVTTESPTDVNCKLETEDIGKHVESVTTASPTKPTDVIEKDNIVLSVGMPDVHMDLTDIIIPKRLREDDEENINIPKRLRDDDEESTASDLDFSVSDEVKRLQKLYKIPNDILRILYSNDVQQQLLETEKDVEADTDNEKEDEIDTTLEDEEEIDEEDEEETIEKEKRGDIAGVKDSSQENVSLQEEKRVEEQDENEPHDHKRDASHDRDDVSSTTGSVLSEIQNTVAVGTDQLPPSGLLAMRPSGETQQKKIVLGCVGIPRDKLPHGRIVMVPTIEIIRAYQKFDEELFRMAHGPDGTRLMSHEDILASLMQQQEADDDEIMDVL